MLYETIQPFGLLVGLGAILSLAFFIGLIINAFRKKALKFWVWILAISFVFSILAYTITFAGIFQLYSFTSS